MDMSRSVPDFRHIDTWLFDLDNTLYRADSNLFAEIESRMNEFIMRELKLSEIEAVALRAQYYRAYGSTLSGLIEHYQIDPEKFLAYVHDIDLSGLKPDADLKAAIANLPGKRYVFTNGCRNHAARVLEKTGLGGLMDGVWDIRTLRYTPKPQEGAYTRIVAEGGFDPAKTAYFEDMAINLKPAYAMGMTTVWIANGSAWSDQGPDASLENHAHIHHTIDDLGDFLQTIRV